MASWRGSSRALDAAARPPAKNGGHFNRTGCRPGRTGRARRYTLSQRLRGIAHGPDDTVSALAVAVGVAEALVANGAARCADVIDAQRADAVVAADAGLAVCAARAGATAIDVALRAVRDPVAAGRRRSSGDALPALTRPARTQRPVRFLFLALAVFALFTRRARLLLGRRLLSPSGKQTECTGAQHANGATARAGRGHGTRQRIEGGSVYGELLARTTRQQSGAMRAQV
jgi:hypothetical protein